MLKKLSAIALLVGLMILPSMAQITGITSFTTSVPVATLNSNFSTLASGAVSRSAGSVTGNMTVANGVTIDGVDIGATLGGTGTPTFAGVTITGSGGSALDVTGGINAGSGNVGIVDTTGKIPAISSTYFTSLSGANLTGVVASTGITNTWTSVTYSAGLYTGSGGMTWGVDSGDQLTLKYIQIDKMMTVAFYINTSDVTAPLGTDLRITIPNGKTAAVNMRMGGLWYNDAGTEGQGLMAVAGSTTYISLYKASSGTNWTATAADNTILAGVFTFEVQ